MPVTIVPEVVNLLTNPSLETAITGWAVVGVNNADSTAGRVTTPTIYRFPGLGDAYFKVEVLNPAFVGERYLLSNPRTPIEAGKSYIISAAVYTNHANNQPILRLHWYDAGGLFISTVESTPGAVPVGQQTRITLLAVAPENAAETHVLLVGKSATAPAGGGIATFDGIVLYQADRWLGYIDGAQGPEYEWLGTAHLSQSRRKAFTLQTGVGRRGIIRIDQRMLKVSREGIPLDDITSAINSANVDLDTDRVISPFALKGELKTAGAITPYTEYVIPYLILEHADGRVVDEPLGQYSILPSPTEYGFISTKQKFEGRDLTYRLSTSVFPEPYTIKAGENVIQAVISILVTEGFLPGSWSLTPTTRTILKDFTWGLDKVYTKLEIINNLLDAIAYYKLHPGRHGVVQSFPYYDLDRIQTAKRYAAVSGGEIINTVRLDPDPTSIVNMVRVNADPSGETPITVTASNVNLNSPVSIPNLGQTIFREISDQNIPDVDTATAIAKRALQEGATFFNRIEIETLADPERNPYDVYEFDLLQSAGQSVLDGRYKCSGWSLGFRPGAANMRHYLGKVEAYE